MSILQAAVRRLTVNLDDRVSGELDAEKQLSIDRKSRTTVDLGELPRAFTARQQELSTLTQRLAHALAVDFKDKLNYELELKNFHLVAAEALANTLGTSAIDGMTSEAAASRLSEMGPNVIDSVKTRPLWMKCILCFISGFSPLLWGACFFVFLAWKPFGTPPTDVYNLALAIALLLVISISSLFTFYQDVKSSRILSGFSSLVPPDCICIRNGESTRVPSKDLVVGDVVSLQTGVRVPADMRCITASSLKIDKSMLTGEAEPCKMTSEPSKPSVSMLQSNNILLMGCNVVEGEGTGLIIATGKQNQLSKIASSAGVDAAPTSLQVEIMRFVFIIASLALTTGTVVIIWWGAFLDTKHKGYMTTGSMIANAIGVIVAYVPEGLPLALSMGLTLIARRLCYQHSVLLKRMGTIETMGSMSLLASDKTGTLTQNRMTVTTLILANGGEASLALEADAAAAALTGSVYTNPNGANQNITSPLCSGTLVLEALVRAGTLCNQSKLQSAEVSRSRAPTENGDVEAVPSQPLTSRTGNHNSAGLEVVGSNGIDKALLTYALGMGLAQKLRSDYKQEALVPFSSATKLSCTVVRQSSGTPTKAGKSAIVLCKGAPEYVLKKCVSYYRAADGTVTTMTPEVQAAIMEAIEAASSKGQRVVAVAESRPLEASKFSEIFSYEVEPQPNFPTDELVFIACVAVSDPPRAGVRQAVEELKTAGIKVAMVTGDAAATAVAIARQVSIVSGPSTQPLDRVTAFLAKKIASNGEAEVPAKVKKGSQLTAMDLRNAAFTASGKHMLDSSSKATASVQNTTAQSSATAVLVLGEEINTLTNAGWDFIFSHTEFVFCRTTPEQKLQIVKEAQLRGDRVGVTGDGVNDSPALKRADVGIAMASGSDVARDASDIVLLSDDFAATVHGVREGRLIFANLRKVIAYQISAGCWSELLPVLASFFIGMPQPLSSFLMIMISCLTDVFAGVALMNEPPEAAIMQETPRDVKKQRLVDIRLIGYSYLFLGNIISIGSFLNWFAYMSARGTKYSSEAQLALPASAFPIGYSGQQLVFAWEWGLQGDYLGPDQTAAATVASSVFFVTLICSQAFHLVSVRTKTPYYASAITGKGYVGPEKSRWSRLYAATKRTRPQPRILGAWCGSFIVAMILLQISALQRKCGTGVVPLKNWGYAIGWGILTFAIAEIRKWTLYLYPNSFIGKTAW